MKPIQEALKESLLTEAFTGPIHVSAYSLGELIDFGASFNPNDKDEAWEVWSEDYLIDVETSAGKKFVKDFCKACKIFKDKAKYGSKFLGNYPWDDSLAEQELLQDELGADPGDEVNLLTCDGDDGQFFYIYSSDNKTVQKAIDHIISNTIGRGDWDWIQCTIEEPEE